MLVRLVFMEINPETGDDRCWGWGPLELLGFSIVHYIYTRHYTIYIITVPTIHQAVTWFTIFTSIIKFFASGRITYYANWKVCLALSNIVTFQVSLESLQRLNLLWLRPWPREPKSGPVGDGSLRPPEEGQGRPGGEGARDSSLHPGFTVLTVLHPFTAFSQRTKDAKNKLKCRNGTAGKQLNSNFCHVITLSQWNQILIIKLTNQRLCCHFQGQVFKGFYLIHVLWSAVCYWRHCNFIIFILSLFSRF